MSSKSLVLACSVAVLALTSCGMVQRMVSPIELPTAMENSDPMEFFLESDFQIHKYNEAFIATKKSATETTFGREYVVRDERYQLVPADLASSFNSFWGRHFRTICEGHDGELRSNGWCAHKETLLPLFYFDFVKRSRESLRTMDGVTYDVKHDVTLYAPKTMADYQNPAWVNFAYSKGFVKPDVWRKKLREKEIELAKMREQIAQEQEKERKRQAAQEAQERADRLARAKAWRQRLERERSTKLFKKGIPVCRKVNGWEGSDYPRYFGYTEGHDENRIQIRVNEKQTSPGWTDANFKAQVIWGDVDDWFICY